MLHIRVRASDLMKICEAGVFPCSLQFFNPQRRHLLTDVHTHFGFGGGDRPGSSSFCVVRQEQSGCSSRKPG